MPSTDLIRVIGPDPSNGVRGSVLRPVHINQFVDRFEITPTFDDLMAPVNIQDTLDSTGDLPDDGNAIGDAYLVNGVVWVWGSTGWTNQGSLTTGPQGEPALLNLKGTVPLEANLPTSGNVINDVWVVEADGHGWAWTTDHEWVDIGAMQGPAGPGGADTQLRGLVDARTVDVTHPTYGATGDGVTDDTDAIQDAVTAAAGKEVYFPDGTYLISDAITVPSNTEVELAPGATLIQDTINRPYFDCYGVHDIIIKGTGSLRYNGDRTFDVYPGSFRGAGWHEYHCGVYIGDCERVRVDGLNMYGWEAGVTIRGWDGAAITSYLNKDITVENLGIDTCEFGVLCAEYDGLTIRNIRGSYIQRPTGAATPPPAHMIYSRGDATEMARNLTLENVSAYDSTGSMAVQVKYVNGGVISNIQARNCPGTFKITDSKDVLARDIVGLNDNPVAASYSVLIEDDNGETERITLSGVKIEHGTADRGGIIIKGDDITVNDFDCTGLFTADTSNALIFSDSGARNQVNRPKLRNASTYGYYGIVVAGSAELNVVDPDIRTVGIAAYYTTAGSTGKLQFDASRISFTASGAYTSYFERHASASVFVERTPRTISVTTTGAGQEKFPNASQVARYILTLDSGDSPVYVKTPTAPFVDALLSVEIINASGGAFTVNWDAIYKFQTAYANPASGTRQAFTFRYDGTDWQEVSRSG